MSRSNCKKFRKLIKPWFFGAFLEAYNRVMFQHCCVFIQGSVQASNYSHTKTSVQSNMLICLRRFLTEWNDLMSSIISSVIRFNWFSSIWCTPALGWMYLPTPVLCLPTLRWRQKSSETSSVCTVKSPIINQLTPAFCYSFHDICTLIWRKEQGLGVKFEINNHD